MKHLVNEELISLKENIFILFYNRNYPFIDLVYRILNNSNSLCIDIQQFPKTIIRFNIKSAPTLIFFKNGKEKKRVSGVIEMCDLLERYML